MAVVIVAGVVHLYFAHEPLRWTMRRRRFWGCRRLTALAASCDSPRDDLACERQDGRTLCSAISAPSWLRIEGREGDQRTA
jgi:hypothetical protein